MKRRHETGTRQSPHATDGVVADAHGVHDRQSRWRARLVVASGHAASTPSGTWRRWPLPPTATVWPASIRATASVDIHDLGRHSPSELGPETRGRRREVRLSLLEESAIPSRISGAWNRPSTPSSATAATRSTDASSVAESEALRNRTELRGCAARRRARRSATSKRGLHSGRDLVHETRRRSLIRGQGVT